MKKNLCKTAVLCLCAADMAFRGNFVSLGAWQTDGMQWQYRMEDSKKLVRSAWYQADGCWYWFDENGIMKTGWHLDTDGKWYFLNPISDGTKGRMMTGWQWIDGYCYYLEEKTGGKYPLGAMYAQERTPDGYETDKNGAWADSGGVPVYRPGKGILTGKEKKNSIGIGGTGKQNTVSRSTVKQSTAGGSGGSKTDKSPGNGASGGENPKSSAVTAGTVADTGEKKGGTAGEDTNLSASVSQVSWQVHFTDSSVHQLQLAPSRSGTAEEGTDLTIYFQTKIIDAQNRIWKSLKESPYIMTFTGPQDRIVYVEYEEAGQAAEETDPWQEEREHLQKCLETARQQESDFLGEKQEEISDSKFLVWDKDGCDIRLKSAASRIKPGEGGEFYVIGKNYIPEGSVLAEIYGDDMEYSNTVEDKVTLENDVYILSRFQLYRAVPERKEEKVWSGSEKRHWNIGDVQEREIDGVKYRFRCIDQNYGDETDRSRQKALFLCDTVIPANTGSSYSYEKTDDGTYRYIFNPGPVVSFGDSANYKYSNIRKWLGSMEKDLEGMEEVPTGVDFAYEGSTKPGSRKEMSGQEFKASYIGSQTMTDRLFILSVDEAVTYGSWLWRFEGAQEENPESQQAPFCKSYWLRTPYGDKREEKVYVVDLIEGNIRPQAIKPEGNSEDPELNATGTTGIRPAFTAAQN